MQEKSGTVKMYKSFQKIVKRNDLKSKKTVARSHRFPIFWGFIRFFFIFILGFGLKLLQKIEQYENNGKKTCDSRASKKQ